MLRTRGCPPLDPDQGKALDLPCIDRDAVDAKHYASARSGRGIS